MLPTWEQPWYSRVSLWHNFKRVILTGAFIIGTMAVYYATMAYLSEEVNHGRWGWYFVVLALLLAGGVTTDLLNGRYGPWRKKRPQMLRPGRDWEDVP